MPVFLDNDGEPIELGAERGDLRYNSGPWASWEGEPFIGGRPISFAKMFATQPWVAIAVMRMLTWATRVPLKVYRRIDDEQVVRLRAGEHRLASAIREPWPRASSIDLVWGMLGPLCVHGNSLLGVEDGAGGKLRFEEVDWRNIAPIRANDSDPNAEILGWREYTIGEQSRRRPATEVQHTKWWSPLGNLGVSPLRQLGSTLSAETAAVKWQINTLKNAVRPHGVVEMNDAALQLERQERQEIYDDAVDSLRRTYGGEENAGKLPVMPPGLKWTTAERTTAVEAELIDQRAVNRVEVAAVYQLPPPSIAILDRATFNNIVELRQMAYTDGLAPPLVLCEASMNSQIVWPLLREDDIFVEFDFAGILRGDRLKEIKALREAIGMGLMTPHEGRGVLNLARTKSENADSLWMPKNNLRPIDEPEPTKGGASGAAGKQE
jgi:HK97 family phage portal protein